MKMHWHNFFFFIAKKAIILNSEKQNTETSEKKAHKLFLFLLPEHRRLLQFSSTDRNNWVCKNYIGQSVQEYLQSHFQVPANFQIYQIYENFPNDLFP